ncbi:MAG: DUF7281 domain-containing protein [Mesonia sp.]|uniref:DUF7281 domain-containing protein n=1 Tax=Mesonia sp. TaxID=1960830 RepID=UPI003F957556
MKMTLKIAKILICLIDGESIAASSVKSKLIDNLVRENILFRKGKHRKTLSLLSENGLRLYLANQLQINDLYKYISALENENSSRAEFVKITTDSKHSKERAFQGFLVNCYSPIRAELNHQQITLHPAMGSFVFIYDYKTFKIPAEVTVVGVENAKNFSQIHQQKYLFEDITPLFVSRYPQNQNKDFIKWMQSIPNKYLHFGDFDVAGIGIYLNEYKKHLGSKANFFIPENIGKVLQKSGNRERYNKQKINFKSAEIEEKRLLQLLKIIQTEKKGLDQEVYIKT